MACKGRKRTPMERRTRVRARAINRPSGQEYWGIMIPRSDAAAQRRTQDVVFDRDRAVSLNRNAWRHVCLRTFCVKTFNIITIMRLLRPRVAFSPQKRPIAVSAGAFGPPLFQRGAGANANDPNTHPRPHTPRPLLTEF